MSKIEKVKEIMGLGENFHMCDVSEVTEKYIHLESWDEDVEKDDFDLVAELIASDEYDMGISFRKDIPWSVIMGIMMYIFIIFLKTNTKPLSLLAIRAQISL